MSQQEMKAAWDSFVEVFYVVLPLVIVSALVSLANFFQRHWGVEPFVFSKLAIGLFSDAIYGTLVGLATLGAGKNHFLAWAVAGAAVHFGLSRLEKICRKILYTRYGVKEDEEDENISGKAGARTEKAAGEAGSGPGSGGGEQDPR